jgi:hypothetical protein
MQRRTTLSLLLPLSLALACDDPDLEGAPDRGEDDADLIDLRPAGSGTFGGSTHLNTALLFNEAMPVRHFSRGGATVTYDDPRATMVTFLGLRLAAGLGNYSAVGNTIDVEQGTVRINGTPYTAGQLQGSEWQFIIEDGTLGPREVVMTITGVGLAGLPGGGYLPLYNFTLNNITAFYESGPWSACAPVDVLTESGIVTENVGTSPAAPPNNFQKKYAAVLYGGVKVSETGTVSSDGLVATLACISGAVGKAGLWGYPPWISSYNGLNGVEQLQGATRAIRADFCADGISHTVDGTPIQIRDRYWNTFDDPTEPSESVWGANGSECRVSTDRLASGTIYSCGGALATSCNQSASDWMLGSTEFMWTKVDPAMHAITPKTPCLTAASTPRCADPGVTAVVCAADPYCCNVRWDSICVNEVTSLGTAADACCRDNGGPGCGDTAVSACVGGYDAYCTATRWDSYCSLEVENLGCGLCR